MAQTAPTEAVDLTSTDTIGLQRRRLERQLADLRRARGKALADAKPFDNNRIATVEAEIAALDDVEVVVAEREREEHKGVARANYLGKVTLFRSAHRRRLEALARAETAAREFAEAAAEVVEAAAAGMSAVSDLARAAQGIVTPNDVSVENVKTRLAAYLSAVLRAKFGNGHFGPLAIGPRPDGPTPDDDWATLEGRFGDIFQHLERHAPPAME